MFETLHVGDYSLAMNIFYVRQDKIIVTETWPKQLCPEQFITTITIQEHLKDSIYTILYKLRVKYLSCEGISRY